MASDSKPPASFDDLYPMRAIGTVSSPYKERFGTPRQPGLAQTSTGTIELFPQVPTESLDGLSGFSHLWVIFVFHKDDPPRLHEADSTAHPGTIYNLVSGTFRRLKAKVHPPRLDGKSVGVFATRSPHRPNSIGLSCVEIEKIEGRSIHVRGLDLVDGTVVLDLKPYLASADSQPEARSGWVDQVDAEKTQRRIRVEWTADESLAQLSREDRAAIEDILSQDPRPVCYRKSDGQDDPYMSQYGFFYGTWNIVYTAKHLEHEFTFTVERIERVR